MSFFAAPTDISVLVIDDEEAIREVLDEFLSMKDFKVKTAANGFEALDILKESSFDVILLDIKMPGMDGIQVLRKIKELSIDSVVIMMTAFGTVETATEAFRLGAHDYLLKPFNSDMIFNTINNAIEQRKLKFENIYLKSTVSLFDVAQAVENSIKTDVFIERLGEAIRKETGAEIISIYLYDDYSGEFENHHTFFLSKEFDAGLIDKERIVTILRKSEDILTTNSAYKIFFTTEPSKTIYSFMVIPLRRGAKLLGFINMYSFDRKNLFTPGQKNFMKVFASYFSATLENNRLYSELLETFNQTMQGFAHALEAKDVYTQGHSERVTTYSVAVAQEMNLTRNDSEKIDLDAIYKAGRLHDIGKIGLQYEKLNKPGKLTDEEFEMFKKHPVIGKKILEPIRFLSNVVPLVYHHHERFDGKGYPEGLSGEEIPLGARILAITDTYDAMTSDRPYRKALSHQTAIDEIFRFSGTQFDPQIIPYFVKAIDKYRAKCKEMGLDCPE